MARHSRLSVTWCAIGGLRPRKSANCARPCPSWRHNTMRLVTADWSSLAWTQLWQVTALIALVGLVQGTLCRRRPHLAYALWMVVMLKCLTPPIISSPTGVFGWLERAVAVRTVTTP